MIKKLILILSFLFIADMGHTADHENYGRSNQNISFQNSNLCSQWDFEEGSGISSYSTYTSHVATFTGTVASMSGSVGKCWDFDETTTYGTVPDNADWNFGAGNFTVACDLYLDILDANSKEIITQASDTSNYTIFQFVDITGTGDYEFDFEAKSAGADVGYISTNIPTANKPKINHWYSCVWVRNGSTLKFYLNGVSQPMFVTTALGTLADIASPLYIGWIQIYKSSLLRWNGKIDRVRISKEAWTEGQVQFYSRGCHQ